MNKVTRLIATAVASTLMAVPAVAADFSYSGNTVTMTGGIYSGDGAKFVSYLKSHPATNLVLSMNGGGKIKDAEVIANYVDSHNMAVSTDIFCRSACAYIWLVGAKRSVSGEVPSIHPPFHTGSWKIETGHFYDFFAKHHLPKGLADYVIANSDGANNDLVDLTPSVLSRFGL